MFYINQNSHDYFIHICVLFFSQPLTWYGQLKKGEEVSRKRVPHLNIAIFWP